MSAALTFTTPPGGGWDTGKVGRQAGSVKALSQSRSFVTAETSDPAGFIDGQLQLARTKGFVTARSAHRSVTERRAGRRAGEVDWADGVMRELPA